jgi:hypothetical protein
MFIDVEVQCPACWEMVPLQLDPDAVDHDLIEDCPVCCRPMRVRAHLDEDRTGVVEIAVERAD